MGGIGKSIGGFLSGEQGEYYQPSYDIDAYKWMQDEARATTGKAGQEEYLKKALEGQYGMEDVSQLSPAQQRALAENPLIGSMLAQEALQRGQITGQMYGKGGELSKALADVQGMRGPDAYKLKPEDYTAYGQMSGELARAFGGAESDLSQQLAARGLAGAGSGAAMAGYGQLQGNKSEQLAGLQRQIADQSMARAMQKDQMLRNYALQMQQMAGGDIQNQFGRQMAGVGSARNMLQAARESEHQQNVLRNQAEQASMQSKREGYSPGFFEMGAAGLKNSAYNIGASPGKFASSAAGSAGGKMF